MAKTMSKPAASRLKLEPGQWAPEVTHTELRIIFAPISPENDEMRTLMARNSKNPRTIAVLADYLIDKRNDGASVDIIDVIMTQNKYTPLEAIMRIWVERGRLFKRKVEPWAAAIKSRRGMLRKGSELAHGVAHDAGLPIQC
jgi:hypothetical protein